MSEISRRQLLLSLPALAMAPRAFAQADPPIRVRGLNHLTLAVSDPKRSVEFYQGLFGMPVQTRQGTTTALRIVTQSRVEQLRGQLVEIKSDLSGDLRNP